MADPIPVVDLFAGPGGLGEGFSAFVDGRGRHHFRIAVSAEMNPLAHATLRLRAFFRQFPSNEDVPAAYYEYIAGAISREEFEADPALKKFWEKADREALCLELGKPAHNRRLDRRLQEVLAEGKPWVLIGGPPCQAYSLVGRARNKGKIDYTAEDDSRHFLYKEYLRIIRKFQPSVFVMENVKGILSSEVSGEFIFRKILSDLTEPFNRASKSKKKRNGAYRLYSFRTGKKFEPDNDDDDFHLRDFVLCGEDYEIPQRRHRVFILGVLDEIDSDISPLLPRPAEREVTVSQAIGDLPPLRSGVSGKGSRGKLTDSYQTWLSEITKAGPDLVEELKEQDKSEGENIQTAAEIDEALSSMKGRNMELNRKSAPDGGPVYKPEFTENMPKNLKAWFEDERLRLIPNHETRTHMPSDLLRYLFCSAWGRANEGTPKAPNFPVSLTPAHLNWKSGKFADRFRVQVGDSPATTITSHIAKDGHYYIHYDPEQCRSLTVREAARIQTFPDNYFFEGSRTSQYTQVGNAVPPFLARGIAETVWNILKDKV